MVNIIVQKYGGTSLSNEEKILNGANKIKESLSNIDKLIVVVSAMGNSTDNLVKWGTKSCIILGKPEEEYVETIGKCKIYSYLNAKELNTIKDKFSNEL